MILTTIILTYTHYSRSVKTRYLHTIVIEPGEGLRGYWEGERMLRWLWHGLQIQVGPWGSPFMKVLFELFTCLMYIFYWTCQSWGSRAYQRERCTLPSCAICLLLPHHGTIFKTENTDMLHEKIPVGSQTSGKHICYKDNNFLYLVVIIKNVLVKIIAIESPELWLQPLLRKNLLW